MCAKKLLPASGCVREAGLVPSVETRQRASQYRPPHVKRPARGGVKPGQETMQAVMRKREGTEPRQAFPLRGGRASMRKRRQHPSELQRGWAPPGSETMACIEGEQRNLGDLFETMAHRKEPDHQSIRQGLKAKSGDMFPTEVRCSHTSEDAG